MDRDDILAFAHRDWSGIAEAKTEFWLASKRGLTASEILAIGDTLRQHALALRPDWPGQSERDADLAVHVRVAESLRAVSSRSR